MARYKIDCCHNCPNRKGGCHSTCEKYKVERAEYEATMAEVKKKQDVQRALTQQEVEKIERTNKRFNRKGR